MNSVTELLATAEQLLSSWIQSQETPGPNRLDVVVAVYDLLPAVQVLQQSGWGYLAAITGLDLGPEAGQIEVLYHFCSGAAVVTLRVPIERDAAVVPSLCGAIPSAGVFERELMEMFGVTVDGAPNTDRLFLPDEWPEGVYPLRKDFEPNP
jgi:Ni,Fe-hydrogenase III component G